MSAVSNNTGRDLWSNTNNQTLRGTEFNDVLHATHNGVKMTGGLGKDHYHVRLAPDAQKATGVRILDFNATQSDRLVINGIEALDKTKVTITLNGNDYDISYDGTLLATVNLQYTNAEGKILDWNPDLEQATKAITKMVRGGQLDGMSGYYYGTEAAQHFRLSTMDRTTKILDFDPDKDTLGLALFRNEFPDAKQRKAALNVKIEDDGDRSYLAITRFGEAGFHIYLKKDAYNLQNFLKVAAAAAKELGIPNPYAT